MRKLFVPILVILLAPLAVAKVWTTVYRCDETTPLAVVDPNHPTVYRDIMVGTRLVIVISSDKGLSWWGGLALSREDAMHATLSGRGCARGYAGPLEDCPGSCLPAAGKYATANPLYDPLIVGLEFNTDFMPGTRAVAGDWFVVDYRAEQAGTCDVGFYDFEADFDLPRKTLSFTHVPSRDFNGDTVVNFGDLALLTAHWGTTVDPNSPTAMFDLDVNARIDVGDLSLFSAYWLERTECRQPVADPNR